MRRPRVNSPSSLASSVVQSSPPPLVVVSPLLLPSSVYSRTPRLSFIRLFAVVSVIASQFCSVLSSISIEPTTTTTTTTTGGEKTSTGSSRTITKTASTTTIGLASMTTAASGLHLNINTENNNLYFDAFDTAKTISSSSSSTAMEMAAAATTLYTSQTPAERLQLLLLPSTTTLSTQRPYPLTSTNMNNGATTTGSANSNSNTNSSRSLPINRSTLVTNSMADSSNSSSSSSSSSGNGWINHHPYIAATLKSVRSTTSKQSGDSKSNWIVGGGAGVGGGAIDGERPRTFRNKHHHEHHWGPFFEEPPNSTTSGDNLVSTAHLFTEAVLNCRVGMLKDKTVMWVRRTTEKVSLLTVGNVTYSGDPRIRVKFQYPNNWRLLINPTQREDAGIYMCQVSTHPPRVFTTNLTVLEPPLRIIDEHERDVGDRYYKSGSTVDLQCQISRNFFHKERINIFKSTENTGGTKWSSTTSLNTLNDTVGDLKLSAGNWSQAFGKLSSQTLDKYFTHFITWAKDDDPLPAMTNKRSSISDKWLNSRITIPEAKLYDSGNYSCSLGRLFTVIVQVQVLTGELPAAVQHNAATATTTKTTSIRFTTWPALLIFLSLFRYMFA